MNNVKICDRIGSLHFIRFSTREVNSCLKIVKDLANNLSTICVTGGGAFKFEENFKNVRFKINVEIDFKN